jgi:peptidoglycan/xylan/chitin deacetylase (PgdA/CDA1 family)
VTAEAAAGTVTTDAASDDVLVLCYHAVSDDWPAMLAIPGERLERQLDFLLGRGYRGTTFLEAVTAAAPGKTVAVTFDDGFRSVVDRALPILTRLGIPGSVFVPSAFMGTGRPMSWPGVERWLGGPHEPGLQPMSWEELGSLAAAGWEVGSHSRSHPRLTGLDDRSLAHELRASREECAERVGLPCHTFAYPCGDVDARVVGAVRDAGYVAAAALPHRMHEASRLEWPRVGVYRNDSFERFVEKATPSTRAVMEL